MHGGICADVSKMFQKDINDHMEEEEVKGLKLRNQLRIYKLIKSPQIFLIAPPTVG